MKELEDFKSVVDSLTALADYQALALVAHTAPIPIWIKSFTGDDFGVMVYHNKAFLDDFNVKPYIGQTDYASWPASIARKFRDNDRDVLTSTEDMVYTHWADPIVTGSLGPHYVAKWVVRKGDMILMPGMLVPAKDGV